ncbi:MAG: DUF3883 domain-containing protein [Bacteroidales bacterium]|jgi:hypothetical protein|nr:DUF3883 domain-containing protein [Bacteroidales bacterium]
MNNEIIDRKIKAFDYNEARIKNALNIRKEFLKRFPKDKLLSLTKEEYALGVEESRNDSFCYWLETKLEPLGNIHGGTARKFGVFYGKIGKTEKKWQWSKWTNENFDIVKQELYNLVIAGEKRDYDKIEQNELSPMFKGKILATYFPNDYLPVFSFEHIKYFLKQFEIYEYTSLEKTKKQLLKIKNNYAQMKDWDNSKFMYFLYSSFPELKEKDKKEIDEETPEIIAESLQIINDTRNYFPKEKKGYKKGEPYKPDYEKVVKNRNNIGKAGENAVFEYEKKRLSDANRKDLADKVEWISKIDDSQGYDIKSYNEKTGIEIHIEVKTTENDNPDNISFYLTDNELNRLKKDNFCQIYYVFCINKKTPKIRIIGKEKLIRDFDKLANPVLYKINCELK